MTIVCHRHGFVVTLVETSEPDIQILRMDVSKMPVGDDLESAMLIISTFIEQHNGRLVLHPRHVESDNLEPPDMPGMLCIVGKIMQHKNAFDANVTGIVVQGQRIDDLVIMAKNLFLSLYSFTKPFDLVSSDEDVQHFITNILKREAKKRRNPQ